MPLFHDPDHEPNHLFLRRESAGWHAAVEEAFAGCDLGERAGLATFLTAQARAVFAIEAALDRSGVKALLPTWPMHKRSAALREDLRTLEVPAPAPVAQPQIDSDGQSLGVLYVVEGSRLGGKLLLRSVLKSADPRVRSAVHFLGHEAEAFSWAAFRRMLDEADVDQRDLRDGAERAFACFLAAAQPLSNVS